MGIWALNWAFEQPIGNATGKAVLLAVAKYANDSGTCYPGTRTLARLASCNEKTVRIWLQKLAAMQLLLRAERHHPDGKRTTDLLTLPVPLKPATTGQLMTKPAGNEDYGTGANARAESKENQESRRKGSINVVELYPRSNSRKTQEAASNDMRLAIARRLSTLVDKDDP